MPKPVVFSEPYFGDSTPSEASLYLSQQQQPHHSYDATDASIHRPERLLLMMSQTPLLTSEDATIYSTEMFTNEEIHSATDPLNSRLFSGQSVIANSSTVDVEYVTQFESEAPGNADGTPPTSEYLARDYNILPCANEPAVSTPYLNASENALYYGTSSPIITEAFNEFELSSSSPCSASFIRESSPTDIASSLFPSSSPQIFSSSSLASSQSSQISCQLEYTSPPQRDTDEITNLQHNAVTVLAELSPHASSDVAMHSSSPSNVLCSQSHPPAEAVELEPSNSVLLPLLVDGDIHMDMCSPHEPNASVIIEMELSCIGGIQYSPASTSPNPDQLAYSSSPIPSSDYAQYVDMHFREHEEANKIPISLSSDSNTKTISSPARSSLLSYSKHANVPYKPPVPSSGFRTLSNLVSSSPRSHPEVCNMPIKSSALPLSSSSNLLGLMSPSPSSPASLVEENESPSELPIPCLLLDSSPPGPLSSAPSSSSSHTGEDGTLSELPTLSSLPSLSPLALSSPVHSSLFPRAEDDERLYDASVLSLPPTSSPPARSSPAPSPPISPAEEDEQLPEPPILSLPRNSSPSATSGSSLPVSFSPIHPSTSLNGNLSEARSSEDYAAEESSIITDDVVTTPEQMVCESDLQEPVKPADSLMTESSVQIMQEQQLENGSISLGKRKRDDKDEVTASVAQFPTFLVEPASGDRVNGGTPFRQTKAPFTSSEPEFLLPNPRRSTLAAQRLQLKKLTKPFRSPAMIKKEAPAAIMTPSISSFSRTKLNDNALPSTTGAPVIPILLEKAGVPSGQTVDLKMRYRTARASAQFKSPLAGSASSNVQPSIRLTPNIQALEQKLQILKRAVKVKHDGQEDLLERLVEKWTDAGREVAWEVWDLVKDSTTTEDGAWNAERAVTGKHLIQNSWGWNDREEQKKLKVGDREMSWGWDEGPEVGNSTDCPDEGQEVDFVVHEEEDEEKPRETLGKMLMRLGIAPNTLGWNEIEETFMDM